MKYDASRYFQYGYEGPRFGGQWNPGSDGVVPGSRAAASRALGAYLDPEADAPLHTKYPALADYPLVRKPSSPEVIYPPVGDFGPVAYIDLGVGIAAAVVDAYFVKPRKNKFDKRALVVGALAALLAGAVR